MRVELHILKAYNFNLSLQLVFKSRCRQLRSDTKSVVCVCLIIIYLFNYFFSIQFCCCFFFSNFLCKILFVSDVVFWLLFGSFRCDVLFLFSFDTRDTCVCVSVREREREKGRDSVHTDFFIIFSVFLSASLAPGPSISIFCSKCHSLDDVFVLRLSLHSPVCMLVFSF